VIGPYNNLVQLEDKLLEVLMLQVTLFDVCPGVLPQDCRCVVVCNTEEKLVV
jgi:hypothetical protein